VEHWTGVIFAFFKDIDNSLKSSAIYAPILLRHSFTMFVTAPVLILYIEAILSLELPRSHSYMTPNLMSDGI
jgi:hypothetical protein